MNNWSLSLIIGLGAAIVDTVPMIMRRLDRTYIVSAFLTWFFLGLIIPRTHLLPWPWLNGALVALMFVLPIVCLVLKLDRQAVPVMLATALILGAGVGAISARLLG